MPVAVELEDLSSGTTDSDLRRGSSYPRNCAKLPVPLDLIDRMPPAHSPRYVSQPRI